jgi:hypothetical protein
MMEVTMRRNMMLKSKMRGAGVQGYAPPALNPGLVTP